MTSNNTIAWGEIRGLTFTIIFEGSALNRDEKLGGNIPSIKKLTRYANGHRGKTFSFISRESMRHHLFVTLSKNYPKQWQPTPTTAMNDVVQFDLTKANILTHAELDAFGYMFTQSKSAAITRKAAVGLQKAIALESWEGDMQFNANHDIANRCGAYPNPVNKEEHLSYYKASFTIDVDKLGRDEWNIINHDPINNILNLFMTEKGQEVAIANVEVKENEEEIEEYYVGKEKITIDGNSLSVSQKLMKPNKKKQLLFDAKILKKEGIVGDKSKNKSTFAIPENDYTDDGDSYSFAVADFKYSKDDKSLKISRVLSFKIKYDHESDGRYILTHDKDSYIQIADNEKKAIFILDPNDKKERIRNIIHTIKNGMYFHTSGENTGIIPKFIVGAALTLPIPLFHSYVDLTKFNDAILTNDYILKNTVFCQNHMGSDTFDVKEAETNLDNFLNKVGLGEASDG